jgi:hypothetical protein
MNEILQALKDVAATLENLGWKPIPIGAAVLAMLAARSYFEPDIIQVNTIEAVKKMGAVKLRIFIGVFFAAFLLQVGLAKPQFAFDWCLCIGFSVMDTMAGYVISSSAAVRSFLKDSLFKGGSNAPIPPAV